MRMSDAVTLISVLPANWKIIVSHCNGIFIKKFWSVHAHTISNRKLTGELSTRDSTGSRTVLK